MPRFDEFGRYVDDDGKPVAGISGGRSLQARTFQDRFGEDSRTPGVRGGGKTVAELAEEADRSRLDVASARAGVAREEIRAAVPRATVSSEAARRSPELTQAAVGAMEDPAKLRRAELGLDVEREIAGENISRFREAQAIQARGGEVTNIQGFDTPRLTGAQAVEFARGVNVDLRAQGTSQQQNTALISQEDAQARADRENQRRQDAGEQGTVTADDFKSQYQRSLEAAKERQITAADRANANRIQMLETVRRMNERVSGKTAVSRKIGRDTAFQTASRRGGPLGERDRSLGRLITEDRAGGEKAGESFMRVRGAMRGNGVIDPADVDRLRNVKGVPEAANAAREVDAFREEIQSELDDITINTTPDEREAIKTRLQEENPAFAAVIEEEMKDENLFSRPERKELGERRSRVAVEEGRRERQRLTEATDAYNALAALTGNDPLEGLSDDEKSDVVKRFGSTILGLAGLEAEDRPVGFAEIVAKMTDSVNAKKTGAAEANTTEIDAVEAEFFGDIPEEDEEV